MEDKKNIKVYRIAIVILSVFLVVLAVLPVIKTMNAPYTVVVKDKDMNFFRAKNLFICGNTVYCSRETGTVKDRHMLPEDNKSGYHFSVMSLDNIISIEIIHGEDGDGPESAAVQPEHLGSFKIRLQGHEGVLILGQSENRVYGTVRFPGWAKGAAETLKGVRINSGSVMFTRSASTPAEMKRLGANYLFKQKFTGTYSSSGKVIKGYMINDRNERHEWDAKKK